jgi:hypothetical protein
MEADMHKSIIAAAIAIAALAVPTGALAQGVVYAAPPVVYSGPVTALEAQDIAAANGVIAIRDIYLDEGLWKLKGRDGAGARVEMRIDQMSGAVVSLNRYW